MLHASQYDEVQVPKRIPGCLLANYVNVFTDKDGETHYSTEQFTIGQSGIHSFLDALEDAYQYSIRKTDWEYVCTLSNVPENTTKKMLECLEELEAIAGKLEAEGYSRTDWQFESQESLESAWEQCKDENAQYGVGA